MHIIEGFERDILPILARKRQTLISARNWKKRLEDFEGGNNTAMLSEFGNHWDSGEGTVCLQGALKSAGSGAFTWEELDALEAGFEGFERTINRPQAYYNLGALIAERFAK